MMTTTRTYATVRAADASRCSCSGATSYTAAAAEGGYVRVCRWGGASSPNDMRAHGPRGAVIADGTDAVMQLLT